MLPLRQTYAPPSNRPLPRLDSAALPAPAAALAFRRQHDGAQAPVAGTGTIAVDTKHMAKMLGFIQATEMLDICPETVMTRFGHHGLQRAKLGRNSASTCDHD